ncbi:MAG: hypothetical protein NC429_13710 [Lachnospiraceae bacterium]|nr:hypothetical protein [Lachnospiraceae bacterium]
MTNPCCIPYVILSVMPRMRQLSSYTYKAALDLGADADILSTKIYNEKILSSALLLTFLCSPFLTGCQSRTSDLLV